MRVDSACGRHFARARRSIRVCRAGVRPRRDRQRLRSEGLRRERLWRRGRRDRYGDRGGSGNRPVVRAFLGMQASRQRIEHRAPLHLSRPGLRRFICRRRSPRNHVSDGQPEAETVTQGARRIGHRRCIRARGCAEYIQMSFAAAIGCHVCVSARRPAWLRSSQSSAGTSAARRCNSSTTLASAKVVVSPRLRPSATSRKSRRMILPLRVFGKSGVK